MTRRLVRRTVRRLLPAMVALSAACSRGLTPIVSPSPEETPAPAPTIAAPKRPPVGPTPAHLGPRSPAVSDEDLEALWALQLMIPVEGITRARLPDTYTAKRDKGIHGALDILAPRSTPVVAAADCIIGRLFEGPVGGIVIYAYDPDERFVYYYAHLERYRRGLAVGDRVAKGSVIGYVGTTGNAPRDTPHLHFQVMKRGAGRAWWDGPPINPYSFFALEAPR